MGLMARYTIQVVKYSAPQSHKAYLECRISMKISHVRPSAQGPKVLRYLDRGVEKMIFPPAPHG